MFASDVNTGRGSSDGGSQPGGRRRSTCTRFQPLRVTEIGAQLCKGNEKLQESRRGGTQRDVNLTRLAECTKRTNAACRAERAENQRQAGRDLMRLWELKPELSRIYYYGAIAQAGARSIATSPTAKESSAR